MDALAPLPAVAPVELLAASAHVPADRHPVAVYLARLAPGSRRAMAGALDAVARILTSGGVMSAAGLPAAAWGGLRYQHTQAVRAALAERYAPRTANKHLAALRGVIREAFRLGYVSAEDSTRAADLAPVRGERAQAGRAVDEGEARALFAACAADETAAGARDAALLALLYGCGLRRSEAVALDMADFNAETGAVTVRRGKGNKARVAYATNGCRAALSDWCAVRGPEAGALLCPVNKAGRVAVRPMTAQAVLYILRGRAAEAGVEHFTPHDLRRTFAGDMLDAGADIVTVQHLMGHANVQTTARYDRRGEATKRKAAELRHVPYVRRRVAG